MLNKKAIAAFAAGATLLSGMAFAAPAFVSAPAFAETQAKADSNVTGKSLYKELTDAQDAYSKAQDAVEKATAKQDAFNAKYNALRENKKSLEEEKNEEDTTADRKAEIESQLTMIDNELVALESDKEPVHSADGDLYMSAVAKEVFAAQDALNAANAKVSAASSKYDTLRALFYGYKDNAKKTFENDTTVKFKYDAKEGWVAVFGGNTTPTPAPKVDYKADVKFLNDFRKNPKSAAADVKAANEALAKLAAAKKANDKAAMKAALKEIHALAEALRNKQVPPTPTPKDDGPALESVFGSKVLYTNYKGLTAELIKRGVTNIGAYDALLDRLEFGLHNGGWDNVVKNFPEHGPKNNCDFLAGLRRHLTKAVKHYEHVEAAVKDMIAELNEDKKDALATENYDAAKVIKEKLALASGLLKVADNNRTRAAALLNSANDHAKDLSCDTAAKEVRAAMDKEPNSPFKKHGQKHDAQKPNAHKPNGGASAGSHKLGKTGATVALVAVAASVLAGMGAALRKIRH